MEDIVTLCGSTRFRAQFTEVNRQFTLNGWIVLAPGVFGHDGDEVTEEQKATLDALHLRKIEMCSLVFVVNPGGYIGKSTRQEISYALSKLKAVEYLE